MYPLEILFFGVATQQISHSYTNLARFVGRLARADLRFSTVWVSQAAAKQRAGRAGRTRPGRGSRGPVNVGGSINQDIQKWLVYSGKSYWNGWFRCTPILGNHQIIPLECPRKIQATRVVAKNSFLVRGFSTWPTWTPHFLKGHPGSWFFRENIEGQ